jgi:hypothetical protein
MKWEVRNNRKVSVREVGNRGQAIEVGLVETKGGLAIASRGDRAREREDQPRGDRQSVADEKNTKMK